MLGRLIIYNASKCTGCLYCEVACTFRRKSEFGTNGSLIRIVSDEKVLHYATMYCRHCKRPVCVSLCPINAISKDDRTGLVSIDSGKCNGCGVCLQCPLGGIVMDEEAGLAANCDLCSGQPACVEFCSSGALQYVSWEEARRLSAKGVKPA